MFSSAMPFLCIGCWVIHAILHWDLFERASSTTIIFLTRAENCFTFLFLGIVPEVTSCSVVVCVPPVPPFRCLRWLGILFEILQIPFFSLETFTYSDVFWLEFLLFQFEELFCFHHEGLKCMVCFCILHCAPPFGSFMHVFFKDLFRARKFYIVGFSWVGIIFPPGFLPFVGIISFFFSGTFSIFGISFFFSSFGTYLCYF